MAEKNYIGITIGPILDTINLTASPVALWASSYLFSMLSRTICKLLVNGIPEKNISGIPAEDIITPFYDESEELLQKNDGVGLFHDRIIFAAEETKLAEMKEIREAAITEVGNAFGIDVNYLMEYIMVSVISFRAENPIMESRFMLDSQELAVSFVEKETENPILSLFSGDSYSKNSGLKKTSLMASLEQFQLKKSQDSFKSLGDIVATGTGFKKYKYYAIVRSDGDNMSKIISSLNDTGEIRAFSKTCLSYCSGVSELVQQYDGVTIYSGGDDLLAILPCESRGAKTPFHFAKEANDLFCKTFSTYNQPVSLSFGITVAYSKFPLYEALADSANLLFGVAKRKEADEKKEKNRVAFRLQKHSGQAEGLVISNAFLPEVIDLLDQMLNTRAEQQEQTEQIFFSAIYKIAMFEKAFNALKGRDAIDNLFKNTFDSDVHQDNAYLSETLPDIFEALTGEAWVADALDDDGVCSQKPGLTMCYLLRIMKFFVEKGGEEI